MSNDINEIALRLDKEKEILNNFFYEGNKTLDEIQEQSIKVDELVVEYMKAQIELKKKRGEIVDKYKDILDQPYRFEIRNMIWKEVRLDNPNVGPREMEQFVTNVYVYCCLLAHGVKEEEIVKQLLYLNNKYFEEIYQQEAIDEEGKSKVIDSLEYLKNLKEKYVKIIKERM